MIRLALDRSAIASGAARTGIARYIDDLSQALRQTAGIELMEGGEFDLWSGLGGPGRGGAAGGMRGALREYVSLPGRLQARAIDVYHAPASRAPGRSLPIPLVVTVHDLAPFEFPNLQGRRRGAQLRGQLRRVMDKAELIIAPSASVRGELTARFPDSSAKVRVVHHGVTALFHRPRLAADSPTFVTVATLERRKNLGTLIDAFARVVAQRPAARLRVIGQPQNDVAALRDRLRMHGLTAAVSLEGYLSDEAVAAAYAGATATVYPSLYEGFGLPVIESMAAGAPVVAGDLGTAREVAGDAALLVDPRDCAAMGSAMLRLMDDTALNHSLSAAGRARAAAFTWERSAREHVKIYEEAVALYGREGAR